MVAGRLRTRQILSGTIRERCSESGRGEKFFESNSVSLRTITVFKSNYRTCWPSCDELLTITVENLELIEMNAQ